MVDPDMKRYLRRNWFWLIVNVAAALPLILLLWDMATGGLSANPIDDITDRTGKPALILLVLSLACTPTQIVTGWREPIHVRKALGLWAFAYASCHFLNFVGNDYLFDLQLILKDGLATKPYIVAGLTAFVLLIPLAITSTRGWQKRLGKRWTSLHKLVYVIGVVAVIHFLWLVKAADRLEPLMYALIIALLLVVRIPPVRRRIITTRRSILGTPSHPTSARRTPPRQPRAAAASTESSPAAASPVHASDFADVAPPNA